MLNRVAWMAGLFEGEGCIYLSKPGSEVQRRLTLVSTDRDVLERLRLWSGMGSIADFSVKGNRKQTWVWSVTRWDDIETFLLMILPYLCDRRSRKAIEMLASRPRKGIGACPTCGNPLRGEGADVYVRKTGHVDCAPCARRRTREWHRRRRIGLVTP